MSDDPKLKSLAEKLLPAILVATIGLAFAVGALWQKVQSLEGGGKTAGNPQASAQPTAKPLAIEQIKELFKKDLIKFGDDGKKLLLVEVADPSCPYCQIAAGKNLELIRQVAASPQGGQFKLVQDGGTYVPPVPELKKLVEAGKASYIYIYSPGHGNGEMGMKALYCAFEKGKFWEVHDLLMTNKGYTLLNDTVRNDKTKSGELANSLKGAFDPTEMKKCLDSGKYDNRLTSDIEIASSLGVSGTPGYILNTTYLAGAYSYKDMEPLVASALEK